MAKFDKNSLEWQMFRDFFQIVEKFYDAQDTFEYWAAVTRETSMFAEKYGVTSSVGKQADRPAALAQALAHAMIDYAEGQK